MTKLTDNPTTGTAGITLKTLAMMMAFMLITLTSFAQKVDYKGGNIIIDGANVAQVVKIKDKENFGITSTFELLNLTGQKLIIATVATDFVPARDDNSGMYYRFTFLASGKVGVFTLSKIWTEKSFGKLIGESGIVSGDHLDEARLTEFIALKSKNPSVAISYDLVRRNRMFNVLIKENDIYQGDTLIGQFKDVSDRQDFDTYEFSLPTGLKVAKVNFTGGNGAKNCILSTNKDSQTRQVNLAGNGTFGQAFIRSEGVDRNQEAIKTIAKWLVSHDYL